MLLEHYQQFEEILKKYQMSERAKQALEGLRLVVLLAPTSAGRNTIIRREVSGGKYYYIVSDTTRPPRTNDGVPERNGREYWFRSENEMLDELRAGEFLEAEIIHRQQVSGISVRELEKARSQHKIAIADVDLEGMHHIMHAKPDTVPIMLIPPSFDEWLRRLAARGRMPPPEQRRRFETAEKIFEDGLKQDYYHFVISEDIEQSAAIIDAIAAGKPNPHQGRGRELIHHLQSSLHDKLEVAF